MAPAAPPQLPSCKKGSSSSVQQVEGLCTVDKLGAGQLKPPPCLSELSAKPPHLMPCCRSYCSNASRSSWLQLRPMGLTLSMPLRNSMNVPRFTGMSISAGGKGASSRRELTQWCAVHAPTQLGAERRRSSSLHTHHPTRPAQHLLCPAAPERYLSAKLMNSLSFASPRWLLMDCGGGGSLGGLMRAQNALQEGRQAARAHSYLAACSPSDPFTPIQRAGPPPSCRPPAPPAAAQPCTPPTHSR